jgi:hypothetical protein
MRPNDAVVSLSPSDVIAARATNSGVWITSCSAPLEQRSWSRWGERVVGEFLEGFHNTESIDIHQDTFGLCVLSNPMRGRIDEYERLQELAIAPHKMLRDNSAHRNFGKDGTAKRTVREQRFEIGDEGINRVLTRRGSGKMP